MNHWNRVLAVMLTASMVLGNTPLPVFAQEPGTELEPPTVSTEVTTVTRILQ